MRDMQQANPTNAPPPQPPPTHTQGPRVPSDQDNNPVTQAQEGVETGLQSEAGGADGAGTAPAASQGVPKTGSATDAELFPPPPTTTDGGSSTLGTRSLAEVDHHSCLIADMNGRRGGEECPSVGGVSSTASPLSEYQLSPQESELSPQEAELFFQGVKPLVSIPSLERFKKDKEVVTYFCPASTAVTSSSSELSQSLRINGVEVRAGDAGTGEVYTEVTNVPPTCPHSVYSPDNSGGGIRDHEEMSEEESTTDHLIQDRLSSSSDIAACLRGREDPGADVLRQRKGLSSVPASLNNDSDTASPPPPPPL